METPILAFVPIASLVAAVGLRRWRGLMPALLAIAIAAFVCSFLAAAAGRTGASILAALAFLAACAGLIGELAGTARRSQQGDATGAEPTREPRLRACDEFEPEDWARVEAAISELAASEDNRRVRLVDLYRFPRGGRPALIVLVRRDGAGGVLEIRTYDLDLQPRGERRRRHAWPPPPPGTKSV